MNASNLRARFASLTPQQRGQVLALGLLVFAGVAGYWAATQRAKKRPVPSNVSEIKPGKKKEEAAANATAAAS